MRVNILQSVAFELKKNHLGKNKSLKFHMSFPISKFCMQQYHLSSFTTVIIIVIMLTDLLTVINLNFGEKCFFGKMVIFAFRKVGNSL